MQPDRSHELYELFDEARQLSPANRADFIRRVSDVDSTLGSELESLLSYSDSTTGPLQTPSVLAATSFVADSQQRDPKQGRLIGNYQIERLIAQGGFSDVYLASRSIGFSRKVAIKMMRFHQLTNDVMRRRFRLEQQVLADLTHENIAQLIDGGTTPEGHPYLVMEYIPGQSITDFSDVQGLDIESRLDLFCKVCRAVVHAHDAGVIHRDIKPANVLVNDQGVPKLVDFGIAKLTESGPQTKVPTLTSEGQLPFTPEYASPEQIKGEPVSFASDVYSLGVVLYELLAGCRPYPMGTHSLTQLAKVVCEFQPIRPSQAARKRSRTEHLAQDNETESRTDNSAKRGLFHRQLSGDLDNIILATLRKEPERRYKSVAALLEDIERYRAGKPIAIQPDSFAYRLEKFSKRNRAAVAASVMVLLTLVVGFVLTSVAWQRARMESNRRQDLLYISDMDLAFQSLQNRQLDEARSIANRYIPESGSRDVRDVAWRLLHNLTHLAPPLVLTGHEDAVRELAPVPGKPWFVSISDDAMIRVWHVETGECIQTMGPAEGPLQSLAVSTDGNTVATGCQSVQLWDVRTGKQLRTLATYEHNVESLAFSPNRAEIAVGVRYQDVNILSMDGKVKAIAPTSPRTRNERLVYLPDGDSLLLPFVEVNSENIAASRLRVWSRRAQQITHDLRDLTRPSNPSGPVHLTHMAVSPDGMWIAATSYIEPNIHVFSVASGQSVGRFLRKSDGIARLSFSPDNSLLAGAGTDGTVVLWKFLDSDTGEPLINETGVNVQRYDSFQAHGSELHSVLFTSNHRLVTAGNDGTVKIWTLPQQRDASRGGPLNTGLGLVSRIDEPPLLVASDGKRIFLQKDSKEGRWYDLPREPNMYFHDIALLSGGDLVALGKTDGSIDVFDVDTREPVFQLQHSKDDSTYAIDVSHDGRFMASVSDDKSVCLWDPQSRQRLYQWKFADQCKCIKFSPDGRWLAIGTKFREIQIIDLDRLDSIERISVSAGTRTLAWSRDGRFLAAGQTNGELELVDRTGRMSRRIQGHSFGASCLAFSPDGTTLVSASMGQIRLWHVATGRRLGTLFQSSKSIHFSSLRFAPDDRLVATVDGDTVRPFMAWSTRQER